ncbi:MAG TPA: hypothetical protein PKD09_09355 [Aggregatilinea sp.]|uniref:hypothetical protein n=1 Tax=Aggregatilinea sp. TaxID=2806333 RepID=UPI002CC29BF3|nr:hypothetical protein [Aggregatilinea sp.]HML21843.1 hypothetical protein [Aggregatilinea sp.]
MNVTVHLNPSSEPRELTIEPGGRYGFLVSFEDGKKHDVNEATLVFLLERIKEKQEHYDPHFRQRCIKDFPWICPLYPYRPCGLWGPNKARQRRDLVDVQVSVYRDELQPVGQMSLFQPHVTHKRVYRNPYTNEVVESPTRPFSTQATVCKEMGVAAMEFLKHHPEHFGMKPFLEADRWRLTPVKPDAKWREEQQERYAGKIKTCVFEQY